MCVFVCVYIYIYAYAYIQVDRDREKHRVGSLGQGNIYRLNAGMFKQTGSAAEVV